MLEWWVDHSFGAKRNHFPFQGWELWMSLVEYVELWSYETREISQKYVNTMVVIEYYDIWTSGPETYYTRLLTTTLLFVKWFPFQNQERKKKKRMTWTWNGKKSTFFSVIGR